MEKSSAIPVPPAPLERSGTEDTTRLSKERLEIDRIVALASLASRREDIDDMLDTLRIVTAQWDQATPFSRAQSSALARLEAELKEYLIHKDPLRSFTSESLEAWLRLHERDGRARRSDRDPATRSLITVILISVISAGLAFVIPYPLSLHARVLLAFPLLFTGLHLGIVWFYLTSLRNFKPDVRRVFLYFCAAAIVLALAFSHYVVIALFNLNQYQAFRYAGIGALFGLPFILMFLGLRLYAVLLGIRSRLTSLPFVLGIAAAVAVVTAFLPHAHAGNEFFFTVSSISGSMYIALFGLMGSVLANKIRHVVTSAYARPMAVICWYLRLIGVSGIMSWVTMSVVGELQGPLFIFVMVVCGIPPQSMLLYAGYLFKKGTSS